MFDFGDIVHFPPDACKECGLDVNNVGVFLCSDEQTAPKVGFVWFKEPVDPHVIKQPTRCLITKMKLLVKHT